jgi:hypothetical protein
LFFTVVSKTEQNDSIMFKSGDYADQGRCWSSPSCCSNHDRIVLSVWMGALSSWKTASLFRTNVWIMGCTWLLNLSTYSLSVIRSWKVIQNTVLRYFCTNHHRTSLVFHCWNRTRHSGL